MKPETTQAIAVTFESCQTVLSRAAKMCVVEDLSNYADGAILVALARCRKEIKGRLTVAHIIERIEAQDGRPLPDEAWAMIPRSEADSACWTEEMSAAYGVVREMTDRVAARRSFLEAYSQRIQEARRAGMPVEWSMTLGRDHARREAAVCGAVAAGRISAGQADRLLPGTTAEPAKRLVEKTQPGTPEQIRSLLESYRSRQIARHAGEILTEAIGEQK